MVNTKRRKAGLANLADKPTEHKVIRVKGMTMLTTERTNQEEKDMFSKTIRTNDDQLQLNGIHTFTYVDNIG